MTTPLPEHHKSHYDDSHYDDYETYCEKPKVKKRTRCESKPMKVCTEEKVLESKKLEPEETCSNEKEKQVNGSKKYNDEKKNKSWRALSVGIASFIILAVIIWALMYFIRPSIILDPETGDLDQSRAILASIIFSLIIVVFVGIIIAFAGRSNM